MFRIFKIILIYMNFTDTRLKLIWLNYYLIHNIKEERKTIETSFKVLNNPMLATRNKKVKKNVIIIFSIIFILFTSLVLYENEKWEGSKTIIKIPNNDKVFAIEYKSFRIKEWKWIYTLSTPTLTKTRYYLYDPETGSLINKKEY